MFTNVLRSTYIINHEKEIIKIREDAPKITLIIYHDKERRKIKEGKEEKRENNKFSVI